MWFRQPQAQAPFFGPLSRKKSLPGGGGGRVESAAARAPTSRFRLPQGASAVRMAPANPEFVTESDGTPKAKPSKELIDAMKRCISASVKEDEVQLSSKAAGIEVHVKADLPWFAGVSASDILSAVTSDATCFTPVQLQELRKFADISVRRFSHAPVATVDATTLSSRASLTPTATVAAHPNDAVAAADAAATAATIVPATCPAALHRHRQCRQVRPPSTQSVSPSALTRRRLTCRRNERDSQTSCIFGRVSCRLTRSPRPSRARTAPRNWSSSW